MFKKTTASREKVKLMVGLTGPSGSGKTYSALQLAYGITGDWTKVCLGDTENKSALYYAGEKTGPWEHIDFSADMPNGYHPHNWLKLIEYAESDPKTEVLILDSISHEWQGKGGCLDIVDKQKVGFSGWKTVTPLHTQFIDKMRHSRLHIIATMRAVQDYVIEQNDRGKSAPRKVGLKSNQREGTDYEFGLIFDIEMSHYATASKDRTGLFSERGPFVLNPTTGAELREWASSGQEPPPELYTATHLQRQALFKIFNELEIVDAEKMKHYSTILVGQPMSRLHGWLLDELEGTPLKEVANGSQ